ncbi:MAG: lipoyl(octanoyl) transferase LipB, partial [Terriglobia bacterium]
EPFARVCAWQKELVAARNAGAVPDLLLLGEHPHVITLGRNTNRANILLSKVQRTGRGVELHEADRGGDVTYHGPGQLVGYPILNLAELRKDVVWYVRSLEEVLIRAARDFGLQATRKKSTEGKRPFYTGVWVGEEKLAALGVHISRWITSHGFAFNVTTDLRHFDLIVPCGLCDKRVTSLAKLLHATRSAQRPQPLGPTGGGLWAEHEERKQPQSNPAAPAAGLMNALKAAVIRHFAEVFNRDMQTLEPENLEAWLGAHQAAAS